MTIVLALLLGFALPVTAVQILWINLITAITLGLALAFETTESGTMARPPRRRDAPILSGELVWHVVLVATLFLASVFGVFTYVLDRGHSLALAQTMAMNTLVVLEIFHLFFIRNIHDTSLTWDAVKGTRGLDRCHRHHGRAVCSNLSASLADDPRHRTRASGRRPPDRRHWSHLLRDHRDRKANQAGVEGITGIGLAS